MKIVIFLVLFLLTMNCSINKVSNIHGFRLLETKYQKITVNTSNKNDIRKKIGPPSSISMFNNIWFFVERKKTNQTIFKLGEKRISKNNILVLEFDDVGILKYKSLLDISDMNNIKTVKKKTSKRFQQDNKLYNITSTLREKINAPVRRKNK